MKMRPFITEDWYTFADATSPEGGVPLINLNMVKVVGDFKPIVSRDYESPIIVRNPYAYVIVCKDLIEIGIWDYEINEHVDTFQQAVDFKLGKWIAEQLPDTLDIKLLRELFHSID